MRKTLSIFMISLLVALLAAACSDGMSRTEGQADQAISLDPNTGKLHSPRTGLVFAEGPYRYSLAGTIDGGQGFKDTVLKQRKTTATGNDTVVTGLFPGANVELTQVFRRIGDQIEETITLKNTNSQAVNLDDIRFGFVADITDRPGWRLCAVPFRVQQDASTHDYSTDDLKNGNFKNAVYVGEEARAPRLTEEGRLRSEAWIWWDGAKGLTVIKYNDEAIELSVAFPEAGRDKATLQFGGAGYSLYGEPSTARRLEPGQQITFGTTVYRPFEGTLAKGYSLYRDYLDSKGHRFPPDYNPPVNWNELYDVGWYHSDAAKLKKHYTRKAILEEARKAKETGCELLYLDPGWEVAEGTTLWDSARLGSVSSLIKTLKDDYGLDLGYRTILRSYADQWPHKYLLKHADYEPVLEKEAFWQLCLSNPEFAKEKLARILEISKQGVRFMMFDEMDWVGTCIDPGHNHPIPKTPLDHVKAVHELTREVRRQCPGLVVECHDPVWPWHTAIYAPNYFQQGFGDKGSYDENWGFEYMWDCLNDLKTGRALALYYYNLGSNIPLYLHITMAADNDNCVFFWWAASTVRHLGIGGKYGLRKPPAGYDPEKRFAAYRDQMKIYKRLKPYFVRGEFHGLAENVHLHTLPNTKGGVITAFNLTGEPQQIAFSVPFGMLGSGEPLTVQGADATWTETGVDLKLTLPAMAPGVICIGEAAPSAMSQN